MKVQKRLRPLMGIKEIFRMPVVILLPAFVLTCGLFPFVYFVPELNTLRTILSLGFASCVFGLLIVFVIVIPAVYATILTNNNITTEATILERGKRPRTLLMSNSKMNVEDEYVIFEFTPEGLSSPIRLDAEVGKLYSKLKEGKQVKIMYAKSNPRIVKFIGE